MRSRSTLWRCRSASARLSAMPSAATAAACRIRLSGCWLWSIAMAALLPRVASSPEILVDDAKPLLADGRGVHLIDDLAMGHDIEPVAEPDRNIDPLLDQQQRGPASP